MDSGAVAASVVFDDLVYFFVLTGAMLPAAMSLPVLRLPLAVALVPQTTIFVILLWPALYMRLAGMVSALPVFRRFQGELVVLGPAFQHLVRPRTLLPVVAVDAICVLLATGLYGLAASAVHMSGVGWEQIAFTYAAGQVLSGLTVIPAALGTYEGLMTGLMALQGVVPASATAAVLLYRVINDFLMALIGLVVALMTTSARRPRRRAVAVVVAS